MKEDGFRVKLIHRDGHLIQNRKSDAKHWFGYGADVFAILSLEGDCREKGVKLIDYTITKEGVIATVDWC